MCISTFIIGGCVLLGQISPSKIKRRVVGGKVVSLLLTTDDSDTATSFKQIIEGACWHRDEEL